MIPADKFMRMANVLSDVSADEEIYEWFDGVKKGIHATYLTEWLQQSDVPAKWVNVEFDSVENIATKMDHAPSDIIEHVMRRLPPPLIFCEDIEGRGTGNTLIDGNHRIVVGYHMQVASGAIKQGNPARYLAYVVPVSIWKHFYVIMNPPAMTTEVSS